MSKKQYNQSKCEGFTLVELMIASVLVSVVVMAAGSLFVGFWRTHTDYIQDKSTMSEISLLSNILKDEARKSKSSQPLNGNTTYKFIHMDNSEAYISYVTNSNSIVYDPDINVSGNEITILSDSVVSYYASDNDNGLSRIQVRLKETEFNVAKTNVYTLTAQSRNFK